MSVLDNYCATQRSQNRLQSFTKLFMTTSIPSSGLNVSGTSTWDTEEELGSEEDEESFDSADENSGVLEEYKMWTKAVEKAVKALGKKRKSLESELAKAEGAEKTAARAQLLVSNLYMFQDGVKTATVNDWENDGKEVEAKKVEKWKNLSDFVQNVFIWL